MTFNGGTMLITEDGVVELPDYIEVLSEGEVKVKVDAGWEGTHTITVTLEDIKELAEDLGSGIMTKSCVIFKGIGWDWRPANNFISEMYWWFQLLKENGYEKN